MSDNFEQWFNSEFPDADLSQHETLKGYNNLKYGWNAAISSLQGEQAAKIAELEAKLSEEEKDAIMWRSVSFHIEEAIRNGMCNFEIEDAYESAIQESKKGGAV